MVGSDMQGAGETFIVNKDDMEQLKEQLQKSIREAPKFDRLENHIDMTVTYEGLRIELTESALGTFFDSGSARMSSDGSNLLKMLAQELGKRPNHIAMEGQTDSKQYPAGAPYGNWELSADRANTARRLMPLNRIREDQLTQVRGFAGRRLRKPETPLDPSNRRISRIVQCLEEQPSADAAGKEKPEGEGGAGGESRGGEGAKGGEAGEKKRVAHAYNARETRRSFFIQRA